MSPDAGGAKRYMYSTNILLVTSCFYFRVTAIADRLEARFALIHKEVIRRRESDQYTYLNK